MAAVFGLALLTAQAPGQQKSFKDQHIGVWTLVSVAAERGDGSKAEPFGNDPRGVIVFTPEGYFSLLQSRRELPKIAANDRAKATAEEATAIVEGSIAYYGTYSVNEADKTIAVKIEQSTYANLMGGPEQKRIITSLTADELKFTNPRTPAGVTLLTAWKRAQAR